MKKIAVCYKWVLNDADIRVNEKSRDLDVEKSKPQINEYDRNGLATGVMLKESAGAAELVGVTCGADTEPSAKDALSRGPDVVYYLSDPALAQADSTASSKVLAAMIRSLGDVDVVICSECSSDEYAQQVGPRLAALLGWPSVSYVSAVSVNGDTLTLDRKLEEGTETVTVKAPVVIVVSPDVCDAPIPGVKQILSAKKKPSHALTLAGIGLSAETVKPLAAVQSVKAPLTSRKAVNLMADGESVAEAVAKLVKQLSTEGVL
ncbi:MAG: electron transfer flavoprotein subunit beta/FixA family protein [Deltaproteobacteria bacterium]|nr:electron transfer flavoprotein subunit beta/FixA family protein [Deltaproteobacteria bacterium]